MNCHCATFILICVSVAMLPRGGARAVDALLAPIFNPTSLNLNQFRASRHKLIILESWAVVPLSLAQDALL